MEEVRPNAAEPEDTRPWLALFIGLQAIQPIFLLICSLGSWIYEGSEFMIHFLIGVVNFVLRQGKIGKLLVGLSWRFDPTTVLAFDIVPDPFVPTHLNSNCFWIGTCFTLFFWVIMFLRLAVLRDMSALVALALVAMECFNLWAFLKAQKLASRQSFEAVRQVLLGQNSEFPNAEEIDASDTDTGSEKKDEDEIV